MMLGVSLLSHTHHLSSVASNSTESLEPIREQECFSLLNQCRGIEEFKQIHAQFTKFGLHSAAPHAGALVKACALSDWGSMDYAHKVFDGIDGPSSFEFNTMIRGYVKQYSIKKTSTEPAILLYSEMQEKGVKPDNYAFPFVLKACAQLSATGEGMQIHGHVYKFGFQTDVFVQNSLISMYGKCGEIDHSCSVFDQMGGERDVASWSALLTAHTSLRLWDECLKLFEKMCAEGWRPDESTLVSVLSSCTHLGALDIGRCTHCSLLRNASELNVIMQTSLIDMYVKCGQLQRGLRIFRNMPYKNEWTYSVMISGLGMHGEGEKALWLFSDMLEEGLEPGGTVYVGVLSACSHAGLLAEGLRCFDRMRFEHHIETTVQHYSCMVDLMGRAGELLKANELIKTMPMEPNDYVWRSLLSACRVHHNLEFAELAFRNLLQLETQCTGDYVLMSNIYTQANRWDEAAKLRTEMVTRGLKQVPGFSRVEVNRKLHTFVSQDRSHPQSEEVHEMLHQMEWQLRFEGYRSDTSQVLLCVDEEEKRRVLSSHSQKLAIAYALVSTGRGEAIRIVRNLRMCSDCHTYTKLISKIFDREIIVRDRNRFHHFREGTCSCRDYW